MNKRVVITGLGVITSIGIGKDDFWRNLIQGRSGITKVTSFDTSAFSSHVGGEIKNFKPENFINRKKLKYLGRASQLAVVATKLAVEDASLKDAYLQQRRTAVCMGTTMGEIQPLEELNKDYVSKGTNINFNRILLQQSPVNNISAIIALEFAFKGRNRMVTTACSAGNYTLDYGMDLLRTGLTDIVVAGGTDAFSKIAFNGFDKVNALAPERCQPFDQNRRGMLLGEGSAALILERLDDVKKRDANFYAEILGCGLSCDAYHMTQPLVEGITQCIDNALKEANLKPQNIDYICAHGTGTVHNDKTECGAIRKIFGNYRVPVSSIKSMLGHTMGAASAIEAVACCLALKENKLPPTINFETPDPECDIDCVPNKTREKEIQIVLNNGFAFGGNHACLVLKK